MPNAFQVTGKNPAAPFTLKVHRGEGMCLVAMNWRTGQPPADFVGFAIEYKEPGGDKFFSLKNRLAFHSALALLALSPTAVAYSSPVSEASLT